MLIQDGMDHFFFFALSAAVCDTCRLKGTDPVLSPAPRLYASEHLTSKEMSQRFKEIFIIVEGPEL